MRRCAKIIIDHHGKEQIVRCCAFCSRPNRIGVAIYVMCNLNGYGHGKATKNKIECPDFQSVEENDLEIE